MGRYLIIPFVAIFIYVFGGAATAILGEILFSIPQDTSWDAGLFLSLILAILFLRKATGLHLSIFPDSKNGFKQVVKYSMLAALALVTIQLFANQFLIYFDLPPRETGGVFGLLSVMLFAPVLEELFFRGYLYVYIKENTGIGPAVCIAT